jgi:autotransporter-associated beta strand protein
MMHHELCSRRGRSAVFATLLFLFGPNAAQAAQYTVDGLQAQSDYVPGAFVVLATPPDSTNPTGINYKANTTDMFGDPVSYYSYATVIDTGASGSVISAYEAQARALPTTGETYSDVGIGGTEWFNVSQLTQLKMASVTVGYDGSENLANFSSYGNYKFQIRQQDPSIDTFLGPDPIYVNAVGTPVLNQNVMHVMPNAPSFSYSFDAFGAAPVEYVPTELLPSAPSSLNAASSQLVLVPTTGGALHVPLSYQNFVTGSAPPSTSTNPTIAGVRVIDSRKPTSQQSAPSNWLFDSGAAVTMVGRDLATAIGINLNTETPVATTTIMGIGGDIRTINGYQVQQLILPLTGGDQLVFNNIVVFVPGTGDLPADLPGIFGMNLINKSFSGMDELGSPVNLTNSPFNDWYVVPVNGSYWTGTGTWDNSTTAKWSAASGGTYNQAWNAGADAIFEGTAGTVTVPSAGVGSVNSITFNTDGYTLTGSGAITLTGNGSVTTGAGTDTINCPLAGSAGLTKNGAGTLILSGTNTYAGGTTINAGTLQVGGGGTTGSILGNVANYAALAFNRSDTVTFAGLISGTGGVTQMGPGRLILTGANSYTGLTTVQHGYLEIANPTAVNNMINTSTGAGANITGGGLILDYTGASPITTVLGDLLSGKIIDSAITVRSGPGAMALGWKDTGSQIDILPTLVGDTDLNGTVDNNDLGQVLKYFNKAGGWAQGDFNGDGIVDNSDLGAFLANFNHAPLTLPSVVSGANSVPEPSTFVLFGIGAVGPLAYAWRRRTKLT